MHQHNMSNKAREITWSSETWAPSKTKKREQEWWTNGLIGVRSPEKTEVRQSLNFFSSDVTVIGASSLIRLGVGTQLSSSANVGSHGVTHNHRSTSSQRCWTSSYWRSALQRGCSIVTPLRVENITTAWRKEHSSRASIQKEPPPEPPDPSTSVWGDGRTSGTLGSNRRHRNINRNNRSSVYSDSIKQTRAAKTNRNIYIYNKRKSMTVAPQGTRWLPPVCLLRVLHPTTTVANI